MSVVSVASVIVSLESVESVESVYLWGSKKPGESGHLVRVVVSVVSVELYPVWAPWLFSRL